MASATLQLACMVALYVLASSVAVVAACRNSTVKDPIEERYERGLARYNRRYGDPLEKERRLRIYRRNVLLVDAINAMNLSYKLNDGKFADMTNREFRAKHMCLRRQLSQLHHPSPAEGEKAPAGTPCLCADEAGPSCRRQRPAVDLPSSVYWRKSGAVTPVKDQGACGSFWASSAVAAMDGITKSKTGMLVPLSVQELLDCDVYGGNQGCFGGVMTEAFRFVLRNGGITTESNYPYTTICGYCDRQASARRAATIAGYKNVIANSELALQAAVAGQPVSVAVDARGFPLPDVFPRRLQRLLRACKAPP